MDRKIIKNQGELAYLYATLLLALGTVFCIKADLGMSMIAAPAYCLSSLFGGMMGFAEYFFQGCLLLLFCLVVRMFRWQFLLSFLTAIIYGGVLNLFQLLLSSFTPAHLALRILLFVLGTALCSLGVAFYFNSYLPLSVYELFVKGTSIRYKLKIRRTKMIFDFSLLAFSVLLAIIVFGIVGDGDMGSFTGVLDVIKKGGVYIGTVISAFVNGILIALFDKLLKKHIDFTPKFKKLYSILFTEEKT